MECSAHWACVDADPIGLIALTFLVVAELLVVLELRWLSISKYIRSRDPVLGIVYILMVGLFGLMPWVVTGARRERS